MTLAEQVAELEKELAERTLSCTSFYSEAVQLRTLLEARNSELNNLRAALRTVMLAVRNIPHGPEL